MNLTFLLIWFKYSWHLPSKRWLMSCNGQRIIRFGLVLWHINHWRLFNAKSSLYIYIKYIWFGWVGFYAISTIIDYLMPISSLYIYIKYIGFGLVGFYSISTLVGYLIPNPLYTYILNIYDLVWFGLVLWHINHCWSFNAKSTFIHKNSSMLNNSFLQKYTV